MNPRSEKCLVGVHPDLVAVMRAASQAPQPFLVIYGLRTEAAERTAVASGHSKTMHSRHLPQSNENMTACAVDVVNLIEGRIDPTFAKGKEQSVFGQIAAQVMEAAKAQVAKGALKALADGSPALQWGGQPIGAWTDKVVSHFQDWGHFQLDPSQYP